MIDMQRADTLTVIRHDGTVLQYIDVSYTHTRAGMTILSADGDRVHVDAFDLLASYATHQAMAPDPGEPAEPGDRDILAAYECPAGGLCDCHHQHEPNGRGRWPRCPRCGCGCSLPDPDDALGDPDACPCCHYSLA